MTLWKISYISVATAPSDTLEAEVREICAVAQAHNARTGITGILTFQAGRFAQVIEGPEPELRKLLIRIIADPRHHSVKMTADRAIVARQFAAWSMAYRSTSDFIRDQVSSILMETNRHA